MTPRWRDLLVFSLLAGAGGAVVFLGAAGWF